MSEQLTDFTPTPAGALGARGFDACLIESKSISQSQLAKTGADWEEIDRRLFQAIAKLMGE